MEYSPILAVVDPLLLSSNGVQLYVIPENREKQDVTKHSFHWFKVSPFILRILILLNSSAVFSYQKA